MGTLSDELKRLRRGRGILASDLSRRIGPALTALSGIRNSDSPVESRKKLVSTLRRLSADLPADLQLAFLAAVALHEDAQHRLLEERMQWLADQLNRDIRTARRRVDEAIRSIVAHTPSPVPENVDDPYAPAGWYLASLQTLVRLDGLAPTVMEEREVVAEVDGLEQVLISTNVPRHPQADREKHDLDVEILYGGIIVSSERPTATYFRYIVRLPHVLRRGERHRVGIIMRLPKEQPMYPQYTYQPMRRCEAFDLRLRFGATSQPNSVWQVAGLPRGMVEDFDDQNALVSLDRFGEAQLSFEHLRAGLAYGARWQ